MKNLKFEYLKIELLVLTESFSMTETSIGKLNELGKEGWELVSILNVGRLYYGYFKRQIS